jgi:hypothetical protein
VNLLHSFGVWFYIFSTRFECSFPGLSDSEDGDENRRDKDSDAKAAKQGVEEMAVKNKPKHLVNTTVSLHSCAVVQYDRKFT